MGILQLPFLQAARNPGLIPGIYNTCDQWCMYCAATSRCLAYQCRPPGAKEEDPQDIYTNIASRMYQSLQLLRDLNRAEGHEVPELEALLSRDPREQLSLPAVDDPLEKMGRRYAHLAHAYLLSRPDYPSVMEQRAEGPEPLEVVGWFHMLIAAKIYRALASSAAAGRDAASHGDAQASAKVALLGIERSRAAIQEMQRQEQDVRLDEMAARLRRLGRELEARFPEARGFLRKGLDC